MCTGSFIKDFYSRINLKNEKLNLRKSKIIFSRVKVVVEVFRSRPGDGLTCPSFPLISPVPSPKL